MLNNFTILYVEDEDLLRNMVSISFKGIFKELLLAENGEAGLDIFIENKNNIDIVITDINMPKMNGLDMSFKIRELNKQVPIIITTAHKENEFLFKAIDVGVSKFVTKPIDMKELLSTIQDILEPILLKQQLVIEEKKHLEQLLENEKFSATGKLAAGIIHEINTPLTYIKANAEIMRYDIEDITEKNTSKNLTQSLEKIIEGITRVENIVNSMKEISTQKNLECEETNIYSTLITASTLVWNKFKYISNLYINKEKFDITMDKNKLEFNTCVQKQRIEQVWIIIINNALDELIKIANFEDRRVDIDISEDEKYITVCFEDNAGGIDDNILEDLFQPFKGTKDSSGMGVGLSIAKKIIDDHIDSTIEAFNSENGAIFEIKIAKSSF